MIEVGRSEKIIKEMDQLASEDHTYKATRAEIDVLVASHKCGTLRFSTHKERENVNTIHPALDIHEHFTIYKGYGTLRISSRTTSTILSAL